MRYMVSGARHLAFCDAGRTELTGARENPPFATPLRYALSIRSPGMIVRNGAVLDLLPRIIVLG